MEPPPSNFNSTRDDAGAGPAGTVTLSHVQQLLGDPRVNATTIAASVELASPGGTQGFDSRILGSVAQGGQPAFNWRDFGN